MASYYYLIASLPMLDASGEMPMSYDEFLDYCKDSVSKKRYAQLESLTPSSEKGPLVREWAPFYRNLTMELNAQRSAKLGKDYHADYVKDDMSVMVATSAMNAANPLAAEQILLSYQFEFLDSLAGMHYFDDYALFGYAMKLKLLERQSCFEQAKGKKEFKRLFDQVQQRVLSL